MEQNNNAINGFYLDYPESIRTQINSTNKKKRENYLIHILHVHNTLHKITSTTNEHALMQIFLDRLFGQKGKGKEVGKWLQQNCLIRSGNYLPSSGDKRGHSYKYIRNDESMNKMLAIFSEYEIKAAKENTLYKELNEKYWADINEMKKQFSAQKFINNTNVILPENMTKDEKKEFIQQEILPKCTITVGEFTYTIADKCGRWSDAFQSIRRAEKAGFWVERGYYHNYDIESCMAACFYQLIEKFEKSPREKYFTIYSLAYDKRFFREELSNSCGITLQQAKHILAGLLNDAELSTYSSMFETGFENVNLPELILKLKGNMWVDHLLKQIHSMRELFIDNGYQLDHNQIYFDAENSIRDAVVGYLNFENIPFHYEHDGFQAKSKVKNLQGLIAYVEKKTGFKITFSYEDYRTSVPQNNISKGTGFDNSKSKYTYSNRMSKQGEENPMIVQLSSSNPYNSIIEQELLSDLYFDPDE